METKPPKWAEKLQDALVRSRAGHGVGGWAVLLVLLGLIAVCDYASGVEVSLAIFYLVPVALGTVWFGLRPGVILAVAASIFRIGCDYLSVYPGPLPAFSIWNVCGAFVIMLFVVWLIDALFGLQRQLEQRVEDRTRELRESMVERQRLELEVLDVTTRERAAFGRELHDELGQHLVATALAAQVHAQKLEARDPPAAGEARAIVRWIEDAIAKTRKLARGLLLARIEPDRLAEELEELALATTGRGVPCTLTRVGGRIDANESQCAQLFRITQEAVTNAVRHARAGSIRIRLASEDGAVTVQVEDDGCGLTSQREKKSGMGLRIMQHRAKLIDASFSLDSTPGQGTRVNCRLSSKGRTP